MESIVKLYSNTENEISRFLNRFFAKNKNDNTITIAGTLEWQKKYQNPLEIVDIIGTFIENNDKYHINMWVSLDKDIYINVTDTNADKLIRYLYERYPW